MYVISISNLSSSIVKIPFKVGTPRDVLGKVTGVIQPSKRTLIPVRVSEYIDLERLDHLVKLGVLKYLIKEVKPVTFTPRTAVGTTEESRGIRKRVKSEEPKIEEREA